jgi:hypothetical protein
MRTWEPTAIGLRTSTSAPDALMLSTRPRIILLLWSLSLPCDRFTGQQIGMRSETLASPVPIGFVAATSSFCGLVQARLIEITDQMFGSTIDVTQVSLTPGFCSIGQSPELSLSGNFLIPTRWIIAHNALMGRARLLIRGLLR